MPEPPDGGGYDGRMYFYLCAAGSPASCPGGQSSTDYYDFIEFAIGNNPPPQAPYWINYDTTRVDAFAIKLALDLHDTTGPDYYIGENCATFAEDRSDSFAAFVSAVPDIFKPCAQTNAPYRIPEPGGGCGFNAGGANADYYNSYEAEMSPTMASRFRCQVRMPAASGHIRTSRRRSSATSGPRRVLGPRRGSS